MISGPTVIKLFESENELNSEKILNSATLKTFLTRQYSQLFENCLSQWY